MKKSFHAIVLYSILAIAFTACGNKTNETTSAPDTIVVGGSVINPDTVQTPAKEVVTEVKTEKVQQEAKPEKKEASPEDMIIGTWQVIDDDADLSYSTTKYVFNEGGKGTKIVEDWYYNFDTDKTSKTGSKSYAIHWTFDGKYLTINGSGEQSKYLYKKNRMQPVENGVVNNEECGSLKKVRK